MLLLDEANLLFEGLLLVLLNGLMLDHFVASKDDKSYQMIVTKTKNFINIRYYIIYFKYLLL